MVQLDDTGNLSVEGSILPGSTNRFSLGAINNHWNDVYSNEFVGTGLGVGTISSASDLVLTAVGSVITQNVFNLASLSVAQLQTKVPAAGSIAYCNNALGGGTVVFFDGTNWRRVSSGAVVS